YQEWLRPVIHLQLYFLVMRNSQMHSGMIEKQKISNVIKTILCCFISLQIFSPSNGHAQNIVSSADSEETWSYHFQFTTIQQMHGSFSAKYSGINSLNDSS